MIEILSRYLNEKFNYDLKEYAIYEERNGRSKVVIGTTLLFVVSLVLFILNVSDIFNNFMTLGILIILFAVLVVAPYAIFRSKYEAIIVTPKYLIERIGKKDFEVVEFDEITECKVTSLGVTVKQGKNRVLLSTNLYKEELDPIIDILEAKGKTFDKEKEYMIRKINIIIKDNTIQIEDNEEETTVDKIYKRMQKEFTYLTPGFIEEILFRNSFIEDIIIEGNHAFLYLSSFTVKGGHPENTTFDHVEASDCLLAFVNLKINKFVRRDLNDTTVPVEELTTETSAAASYLDKAVINEWKCEDKSMDISFAAGVYLLESTISYEEVLVGWNKIKQNKSAS